MLKETSQGTQACIDAASTVSGIIGDLDTTILFATAGTLNAENEDESFSDHRDHILKTAKVWLSQMYFENLRTMNLLLTLLSALVCGRVRYLKSKKNKSEFSAKLSKYSALFELYNYNAQ